MTLRAALWKLVSLQAATDIASTKEAVVSAYANVALISALLLSVVSLSSVDQVGEELFDPMRVTIVYNFISFFSDAAFVLCTLTSTVIVIVGCNMNSDEEARMFVSTAQMTFRLAFGTLGIGIVSYFLLATFIFLTWTGAMGIPAVAICWFAGIVSFGAACDALRCCYNIQAVRDRGGGHVGPKVGGGGFSLRMC